MDFDFPLLKQDIKPAAMQAFDEMNKRCQDDRIIAFALYSDEGAMTDALLSIQKLILMELSRVTRNMRCISNTSLRNGGSKVRELRRPSARFARSCEVSS